MKRLLLAAVALTPLALSSSSHAEGLFGGGNRLDPSFCKEHNIRQTVIYVDDTMLVTGQNGWLLEIYNKLTATLVPGERTTLVELSPAPGRVRSAGLDAGPPTHPLRQRSLLPKAISSRPVQSPI